MSRLSRARAVEGQVCIAEREVCFSSRRGCLENPASPSRICRGDVFDADLWKRERRGELPESETENRDEREYCRDLSLGPHGCRYLAWALFRRLLLGRFSPSYSKMVYHQGPSNRSVPILGRRTQTHASLVRLDTPSRRGLAPAGRHSTPTPPSTDRGILGSSVPL